MSKSPYEALFVSLFRWIDGDVALLVQYLNSEMWRRDAQDKIGVVHQLSKYRLKSALVACFAPTGAVHVRLDRAGLEVERIE